ncbi:hypothetical protein L9F63_018925 [Diploptera punctata]|uniref:C2H2-type domain-containing protein n=1 Tax=Diploptera punctata TaxID=6984 RepID=A0AAD7ZVU4_DIPPU|nr:hypothetical protein L9F63_018925 [Diploptera punctata]
MVRHLQLHISSNVPDAIPPSTAPVNPVPCLEKKEMMFDKMTNLAASSHIAATSKSETPSGSLTLTQELEAKLPKFIPEHQRYVCGAPGCSYLTCDETMLRYHLRALHFDETAYRCPHCPESSAVDSAGQVISVERMGAHLKMHDSRLYKCAHCMYHHFQRYVVERHLADKHPEKRPFVHVVREPELEAASSKAETSGSESTEQGPLGSSGVNKNSWHCGLCSYQCGTRSDILSIIFKTWI